MLATNPFAALSASISPALMQAYLILMVVLVAAGTLFDIVHKGSARYFFDNWRRSKSRSAQPLGGGELVSIAAKTAVVDVLASGEFCNARRRIAHLLTMYGFVIYIVTTAVMVFRYPTPATPTPDVLPHLWWIGGAMVLLGGYWFWFFIRVDVAAEGNSPFRVVRADLFVLSLLASVTLGLIWAYVQANGCGHCVDVCPSDIMHIDKTYRRAYNIEPNMCWECYSCVKACPQNAIACRGYADFAPLGHSVRVLREEAKGTVSWRIKFRDGREKNFVSPIRTTPWGSIKGPADYEAPRPEDFSRQDLAHEPDALNVPGGLPTLGREQLKRGVL